jgi:LuxR family maltose regulon positive regulatory protein
MAMPVLTTKLYIPPPRPEQVPRARLLARLDAALGLHHRLILVSAPPGFGKTTLLSEWVAHLRSGAAADPALAGRVAWVSLDAGDNALPRFLAYLIAALQTIEGGVGAGVLGALQAPGLADAGPPPALEPLLTALINELAALPEPVLLVLDDYHLIEAPAIHQALTFLLDHLPLDMGLVLATRADPPLPLSRLRSRGALTELRQADLRFTPGEAAAFLNQTMGLELRAEEIAALEARTEGWIAGLQLASLALSGQGTPPLSGDRGVAAFVEAFAGDDRYVVDYLVEEVLDRQAEAVHSFLLETSILDRLSGPLCDAVRFGGAETPGSSARADAVRFGGAETPDSAEGANAGMHDDSQALLEELDRRNLFLVPLDGKRRWYRYHRLFADLLRHRLHQARPKRVPALHRRASRWYEDNGFLTDAVEHALAAEDFERVAGLIEPASWAHLSQGGAATLLGWLDALPAELLHSRPRLDLLYAWALLAAMQLEAIEARLHDVERRLPAAGPTPIRGEIATIRATLAGLRGDTPAAIELAEEALDHLPAGELHLRGILADILGAAYDASGNTEAASQAYTEAAALCQAAGNPLIALIALGNLARLQEMQGRLRQAADTCYQALELAAGLQGEPPPSVGMAEAGLGKLAYEWDELDDAARHLEAAIERGRRGGIVELVAAGCAALAPVYQARGDLEGVTALIEEAERLVQTVGISAGSRAQVAATRARLWLQQGDLEATAGWASGLAVDDDYDPLRQVEVIALARLLLALAPSEPDRLEDALRLLEDLLRATEAQGWMGQALEILVLQAVALQMAGEPEQAMDALVRALSLGEPEGYVRTFLDLGAPMRELLQAAARRGIRPAYVERLLARATGETAPAAPSPLVEPLSDRELEVLRLIAAGLSNREVARELVITPGTAKWHAHNIYGKLGVHSRTQAVARARELGLLSYPRTP